MQGSLKSFAMQVAILVGVFSVLQYGLFPSLGVSENVGFFLSLVPAALGAHFVRRYFEPIEPGHDNGK